MRCCKLLVILLMICVTLCTAMTSDELEDFSDFLKRTSQLDQNVKTAGPEDDVEDPISDQAWEESGKFEGDLILNEKQRRLIVENVAEGLSRNGLKDSTKRWPNNEVIYYIQREHFSADQVDAIQSGINDLAQASCIKFRPYQKGDRDAVVIQGGRRGCFSQVGYQGGYQVLNLSQRHPVGRGCFRHGTVVHELLHSLGFYHMQSSPDRDDYVNVVWENIRETAKHNFRKYNTFSVSDFGVGYDYESVLHYSRRAFSSNGRDTLVPKMSGAQIGQRVGLSQKDTEKLNRMYCDAESDDAEETTKRTKKKKPKNLPFQGHGIGYHQGKAVVIQLPDAKTYKLPDVPSYTVFDYFSKIPETLPPAIVQRFGIGKKIEFDHNSPSLLTVSQKTYETPSFNKLHQDAILTENKKEDEPSNDNKYDEHYNSKEPFVVSTASYNQSNSLNEEIDRLGGILKTHVYPSQTPDLSAYKINTDYKEFYTPHHIKLDSEPDSRNPELYQSTLLYSKPREDNFIIPNNEATKQSDVAQPKQFEKAVVSNDDKEKTFDETLSTVLALKPNEDFWSDDEQLAIYDTFFTNPHQNNNFSNLYLPKAIELKLDSKSFEIKSPLKNDWYPYTLHENSEEKSEYISSPLANDHWNKLIKLEQDFAESSAEHIEIRSDKNKSFENKKEPEVLQSSIIKSNTSKIEELTISPLNSELVTGLNVSHINEQVLLSTPNSTKDDESNKHGNFSETLLKGDEIKQNNMTEDYEENRENDYEDYNNHRKYLFDRLSKIKNGYIDFADYDVPKIMSEESSTSFEQSDFN